ncbi:NAD dependent epimerase/dehydratase family protein [Thermoascus aurantiacus ATCC 26904]
MSGNGASKKPSVLIVGGLGFIGRFLALYLHENNLASEVRLVDKVLPQLAWLAPEFEEACSKDKFVQADASREQSFSRVFDRANGEQFDYVINCGGETRHSQPDEVYELRSYNLSVALAREAARRGVRAFVECSTAHVYKAGSTPRKEGDKKEPWHKLAKWKLKAGEEMRKIPGLNLVVVRFPHVYGPYDSGYFATGICLARVYKELNRELELLYTKDLKVNTIHVKDAARALWVAAEWRASKGPIAPDDDSTPTVFNVVDHGDTRQAHIAEALTSVFDMQVSFVGSLASQVAKLNLDEVVDDMNELVLQTWADLLQKKGIERAGPISPFLEKDILKEWDTSIDGTLFEQTTGFRPEREAFNAEGVKEMVESYKRMGWWP